MPYKDALEIDNRKQSNYYWSLLKTKNKIISIFLNRDDFNLTIMKISLFILTFNLSFTINALFFDDQAIYEINQENNSYNLKSQISRVIYSAIISTLIGFIAEFFALTDGDLIKIRTKKNYSDAEIYAKELVKKLKIKIIIFYIISIIFNLLFLYYISAFCAIYTIIQTHMISDSLISFLLSISYTLLLTLIPPLIRMKSLKKKNKIMNFLYILSWLISLI